MSTLTPTVLEQVDRGTRELIERRRDMPAVRRRGWLIRRALLSADILGLVFAFVVAEVAFGGKASAANRLGSGREYAMFVLALPAWVLAAKLYGLYDRDEERTDHSTADDFAGVFHLVTITSWLILVAARITGLADPGLVKMVAFWVLAICGVPLARSVGRAYCRRRIEYLQNTVIVGAGEVGQSLARKLLNHPEYGLNLVGFVDADPRESPVDLAHLAILGGPDDLPLFVKLLDVERVILAFSSESDTDTLELVRTAGDLNVQVDIVPRLFETVGLNVQMHTIEGLPLVGLPPLRLSRSSAVIKRMLDVVLSFAGIICLAPVLLAIAAAIKVDSRGPVLYRHERVGRKKKRIQVLKYRTMRIEACAGDRYGGQAADDLFADLMSDPRFAAEFERGQKVQNDPRVTRVGRLLRASSLDELPQLFNVLIGELSLVGPRAITLAELVRYGDDVEQLMSVRPGVTGYWQVNGRSRLAYEDRVRLDLSYIRGWSLGLDLTILARTFRVLVSHGDAY